MKRNDNGLVFRLTKYNSGAATCRDLGHAWQYEEWTKDGARRLRCVCGTSRKDRLDAGRIMSRQYAYIKGYSVKGESPTDVRMALRQLLAQDARRRSSRTIEG